MIFQKSELSDLVGKLKDIIPKKTTMGALQSVLVRKGCLIASDLEITVTVKLEGIDKESDESFLIPKDSFSLISSLPDEEVEITSTKIIGDRENITLKCGSIVNKFQTESAEQYPALKEMGEEIIRAKISAEELKNCISHVLYAIGEGTVQPMMATLCIDCHDGEINFTGMDGHIIAWDKVSLEGTFKLLIPKRTCQQIMQLDLKGDVDISADKFTAKFESDGTTIETRIVEGNYYKTERMFLEMPITAALNRKSLFGALSRADLCRAGSTPVKLIFKNESVTVEFIDNQSEYVEEVGFVEKIEGLESIGSDSLTIGINPKLMLATLKAFDSENVYMNMMDSRNPIKVISDESDLKAVVLPVNIGNN